MSSCSKAAEMRSPERVRVVTTEQVPSARFLPRRYRTQRWVGGTDEPQIILCDHPTGSNRTLCDRCTGELRTLLADIPALTAQLEVAASKQARFVDHGTIRLMAPQRHPWTEVLDESDGGNRVPDRYRLAGFARPAVWARRKLTAALAPATDRPADSSPALLAAWWVQRLDDLLLQPEMPRWARRLSEAVVRAREVIDAPPDPRFLGPCPKCHADLYAPGLGRGASQVERAGQTVQCACGQVVRVQEHLQAILDSEVDDKLLTTSELTSAVADMDGTPVTRNQIDWWAKTGRLPKHQREQPRYEPLTDEDPADAECTWRPGTKLVMDSVTAYKVGEVRRLAAEAAERKRARV